MPEYRRDPISQRWVILAQDRAGRPSEFASQPVRRAQQPCPFCAGQEEQTPPAIASYPGQLVPGSAPATEWQVRVIPNKYPAVLRESTPAPLPSGTPPFETSFPGHGEHEVIIESPQHVASLTDLTLEQAVWAFHAYRDRLREHRTRSDLRYGLLFKNCRGGAGATLEHAHSQLVSTNFVPGEVEQELRSAAEFHARSGKCLFCEQLSQERGASQDRAAAHRVVRESERFTLYCPFASRFPFETWLMPREHQPCFEELDDDSLREVAQLVQQHLRRLESLFPQVAYNYWIHTAPFGLDAASPFHWHIELIPRMTTQAGFEWGSGCFVNPVSPEHAASELRKCGGSRTG